MSVELFEKFKLNHSSLPQRPVRLKSKREVAPLHTVCVTITANNSFITHADKKGNTVQSTHLGCIGLRGSRKVFTHYSFELGERFGRYLDESGVKKVNLHVRGGGRRYRRRAVTRGILRGSYKVGGGEVRDIAALPFNGCRRPKQRRR